MKLGNCILAIGTFAIIASCKNAGDKTESTNDSTATPNTTTTNTYSNTTSHNAKVASNVPANLKTTFASKYPSASNVNWYYYEPSTIPIEWEWSGWPSLDTSDYVANFNTNGSDYWVWYDDGGSWVGTVSTISDYSSLPSPINSIIQSQYSGYNIVSVDKENDKNRTAYEIQMENGGNKVKLLVDENGKIMKRKENINGEKTKEKPIKDSM
jgi:hypothetical protein